MQTECKNFVSTKSDLLVTTTTTKKKMEKSHFHQNLRYRIVSNKRPGGVAIFQKGDVYKRQVFNAKMQCLSLFTMTHCREI